MINFNNVSAISRAEMRHTRRLVRYWLFLVIAYLAAIGLCAVYAVVHLLYSSSSPSVGIVYAPRFLVAGVSGYFFMMGFVLGIIFLGFDVRARDVRVGIVEVLDSRPLTNLELILGRFVALFLCAWVPLVVLVLLLQGLGALVGTTVEPYSLVKVVMSMGIVGVAVAIALVFAVTLLVRHRLIAAVVTIAILLGSVAAGLAMTGAQGQWIDFLGGSAAAPSSDIVPMLNTAWTQRAGMLALALACLAFAVTVHPRLDGSARTRPAMVASVFFVIALLAVGFSVHRATMQGDMLETWRKAHEERAAEAVADIQSVTGSVDIAPGRRLDADLSIVVSAPANRGLDHLLFTLNPGLSVADVQAGGAALKFSHADGLLNVTLNRALAAGERLSLTLRYGGRPNVLFGYLDSSIQPETAVGKDASFALYLGQQRGIFDRRYVALTPGIRWLPASGADVGRDDAKKHGVDYFKVALEVEVPKAWLVAGPGRRESVSAQGEHARFRFAPTPSVPEVALIASQFRSIATQIDGITFEVLLHPDHDRNIKALAHSRAEIERWVAERLEITRQAGLTYPFDAFTIVEVPNGFRSYAGGWRLDTTLAPPAMMLLPETSFPTARFDSDAAAKLGKRDVKAEGGAARVNLNRLVNFFRSDVSGGNVFTGAARSFFAHRTSAVGEGAVALNFTLEQLATLLVSGHPGYFSAHNFQQMSQIPLGAAMGVGERNLTDELIARRTARSEVWDAALGVSLVKMDPRENPERTIDVLALKGGRMAQAIYDSLGPQKVGALLADLVERHAGSNFTVADFIEAGRRVDADLGNQFQDWVGDVGLPGFVTESAETYRLPEQPGKPARYQLLVRLSNPEPVAGFARIDWTMKMNGPRASSAPIRIPGRSTMEFGAVLDAQPFVAYVHPYLSLNRDDFVAAAFGAAEVPVREAEPFDGLRQVPFVSARSDKRIIVDDLDDGFVITGEERSEAKRGRSADQLDKGLPLIDNVMSPPRWSRRENASTWGRYRHTFAYVAPGEGKRRAVMPAQVPTAGVWALEIHLPYLPYLPAKSRGTWHLEVISENGRETVAYNASAANVGWNQVGEYKLPAGKVRVELTDQTDGIMVVADAIAWSPVGVEGAAKETEGTR